MPGGAFWHVTLGAGAKILGSERRGSGVVKIGDKLNIDYDLSPC